MTCEYESASLLSAIRPKEVMTSHFIIHCPETKTNGGISLAYKDADKCHRQHNMRKEHTRDKKSGQT